MDKTKKESLLPQREINDLENYCQTAILKFDLI